VTFSGDSIFLGSICYVTKYRLITLKHPKVLFKLKILSRVKIFYSSRLPQQFPRMANHIAQLAC